MNKKYDIWKYVSEIKFINLTILEDKIILFMNSKINISGIGIVKVRKLRGKVNFTATFKKDIYNHTLKLSNVEINHRFVGWIRKKFSKMNKITANDILIDGMSIINYKTGEFVHPISVMKD